MEQILLPNTVQFLPGERPNVGHVVIFPCYKGYGTTLGNALRRVLLSSLPGAAVESVKIEGVQHEFSTIEGVKEDVVQLILNLKQLAVRVHVDGPVLIHLSKKGVGPVKASAFAKNADVEIMNPDLVIANITDSNKTLEMDVSVGRGIRYIPVSEKKTKELDLGTIAVDSLYTPIRDIGYNVEPTRVGDVTDFEKLTITVETNGTISPQEAIVHATKVLMDHFNLILNCAEEGGQTEVKEKTEEPVEEVAIAEEKKDGEKTEKPSSKKKKGK